MKHVFYLHSTITEAIATAVVKRLSLKQRDVILVCGRGYITNAEWAGFIQKDTISIPSRPHRLSLISITKLVKQFDSWLKQFCDEDFTLYAPQTSIPLIAMLVNHPFCDSFNYLEEGLAFYTHQIERSIRSRLSFLRIWPWYRVRPRCFFESGFKKAYVTRMHALQHSEKNVIVIPIFSTSNETDFISAITSGDIAVFAMQTVKWWPVNDACAYFQAIRDELEDCSKRGDNIFFKLHPEQFGSDEGDIVRSIMSKFSALELGQNVVLETLSNPSSTLHIITRDSSVVLYMPKGNAKIRLVGSRIAQYLPKSNDSFLAETKKLDDINNLGVLADLK